MQVNFINRFYKLRIHKTTEIYTSDVRINRLYLGITVKDDTKNVDLLFTDILSTDF